MESLDALGSALDFAEAGSLPPETADVEKLGAANAEGADLLDLIDDLGIVRKDALDTLAEAHLADGEGTLRALLACDNQTLECLQALLFPFLDLDLDADGVARFEVGEVGALELIGQLLHDGRD